MNSPLSQKTGALLLGLVALGSACEQHSTSASNDVSWSSDARLPDCGGIAVDLDGQDPQLALVLRQYWNVEPSRFSDFAKVSRDPESRSFLLNPENSKKAQQIFAAYEVGSLAVFFDLSSLVSSLRPAFQHFEVLMQSDCIGFLKENFREYYHLSGQKISLNDFVEICRIESISDQEKFRDAILILRQSYGFEADELACFLGDRNLLSCLKQITRSSVQQCFNELEGQWGKEERDRLLSGILLSPAVENLKIAVDTANQYFPAVELLDAGVEPQKRQILRTVLEFPILQQTLQDRRFGAFVEQANAVLTRNISAFELVPLARMYLRYAGDDALNKALLTATGEYRAAIEQIHGLGALSVFEIEALCRMADEGNLQAIKQLMQHLRSTGEQVSGNDLVFLSWIASSSEAQKFLQDRKLLEGFYPQIFETVPVPREQIDHQIFSLPALQIGILDPAVVPERPAASELSLLNLARVALLAFSLKQEQVQNELAEIVMQDLYDRRTEKGGIVYFDGSLCHFELSPGRRHRGVFDSGNGSYSPSHSDELLPGIATFHLHATDKDCHEFSGPSGSYSIPNIGGDTTYVRNQQVLDLVITTLGHPRDWQGIQDQTRLRLNIDAYYVDTRSGSERVVVVDLGVIEVPRLNR